MTDASHTVDTPGSAASSGAGPPGSAQHLAKGAAAPKDRACPYCHVNFTSSSLGRHLDLYIKEKNPKPPDGIHNVDEIRKSRANITRRQARSSKRHARDDGDQDDEESGPIAGSASPSSGQADRRMGPYAFRNLFNTPHWTTTGVITDSDANQQLMNGDALPMSATPGGKDLDPVTRRKWVEERERGRAAELALEELVDSIKAASSQTTVPDPYDFDFFSCSFPELCLRILSAPATLERPTFIPDSSSWPIDPPDEAAYKALQKKVQEHLLKWRETYHPPNPRKRQRSGSPDRHGRCTHPDAIEPIPLYQRHLTTVWNTWASQSLMQKAPDYHMWALRLYALEKRQHAETKKRLEFLETELNRSRIENARLTECQMPREWLHTPASQLPLAKLAADKVHRDLRNGGLSAEKLIAKWRPRVQAARMSGKTNDGDDSVPSRLAMIGPSGTLREASKGMTTSSMAYDGRMPADNDDEEAEGSEEDYEDEEDVESEEHYGEAADDMCETNGTIAPSLKNQMGALANSRG